MTPKERRETGMDVKIRGVDPVIVRKIDELAKKQHMSRNEYLKRCLSGYAVVQDVADLDSRYAELVTLLAEWLEQANDVIETNSLILQELVRGSFMSPFR